MPRKHKDNVVEFPTKNNSLKTTEQHEKTVEDGIPAIIKKIDENRTSGMTSLEKKCDNFEHREAVTSENIVSEDMLRDVEGALKSTHLVLESMNSLLDMLRYDVINTIKNIQLTQAEHYQMGAHLQTLLELLMEKEVINDNEMRVVWERVIQKMQAAAKQQEKSKQT